MAAPTMLYVTQCASHRGGSAGAHGVHEIAAAAGLARACGAE